MHEPAPAKVVAPFGAPYLQVVVAIMLAWALVPVNPYGYYVLLRWSVCASCILLAYHAGQAQKGQWLVPLIFVPLCTTPSSPCILAE